MRNLFIYQFLEVHSRELTWIMKGNGVFFPLLFDIYGQCWSYLWLKSCRPFKRPSLCHQTSSQLSFCNNTMMRDMCRQKNTNVIDICLINFPFLLKRKMTQDLFFLYPDPDDFTIELKYLSCTSPVF